MLKKAFAVWLCIHSPAGMADAALVGQLMNEVATLTGRTFGTKVSVLQIPDPWFSWAVCHKPTKQCGIIATTYPNGAILLNRSKVDLSTLDGRSILVHELVHVTQQITTPTYASPQACFTAEREAYDISFKWAKAHKHFVKAEPDIRINLYCGVIP